MKKFLIIIMFFVAMIFTSPLYAKELQFVQFSDTHLSSSGEDYRGRKVSAAADYLKKAIKEINKNRKIKFVIFSGDNIDIANRDDLVAFFKIANKLNKPYYVLIGNHEVFKLQHFNKKHFMHTAWLHNFPTMTFKKPNYVFKPNRDLVFIVVDGANEFIPAPSGYFKPETLEWLDKQLYKYKNKKVVLVQHFPLIPPKKKRSHNTFDVEKYFQVLNNHDNVIAVLSGHFHTDNVIYKKGIYHMSAPAFVSSPHQYKIITINYEPKYLFADPSEFSIKQELVSVGEEEVIEENNELKVRYNSIFVPSYTQTEEVILEENNEQ